MADIENRGDTQGSQKAARVLALVLGAGFAAASIWQARRPPRSPSRGALPTPPDGAEASTADRGQPGEKEHASPHAELARPSAEERGRHATSPTEIPVLGWKDIIKRTYAEISDDRLLAVAAGVTFYALLAVFPAIGAFVSLYGLVADRGTLAEHLGMLSGILPAGGVEIVREQLTRLTSGEETALGFAFLSSLLVALWSANAGVKALFDALNVIYDEREKRGFFRLNATSLMFTAGALILMVLGLVAVAVVPAIIEFVGMKAVFEKLLSFLRWPVLFIAASFGISVLFRYGPSREVAQWRWLTLGSVLAAALWIVASLLFSWYAANFGAYNETYGTLGAAIGFMMWIWLSTAIILVGAEINAETEHQTAKDSTTGPATSLGQRGATMADTVGEAKA